jgi:hypothetical protein
VFERIGEEMQIVVTSPEFEFTSVYYNTVMFCTI